MTIEKNEIIPRILRDMNDGVLVVGEHGEILYLNDRGCNMLGVDGKKKIGIVVVFSDVTEVAKLNRQRREASTVLSIMCWGRWRCG